MKLTRIKIQPVTLVLMLICAIAKADDFGTDREGFHGYLRSGAGITSAEGGRQSCFGLGGNTMRYRLGNECDAYFSGGYTKEVVKADEASFVATLWLQEYAPNSDFSNNGKTSLTRAYVEAKDIDFLSGGVAWVGQRHYRRPDINMLDLQYINLNGVGAGLNKMNLGPGKFSYAVFKDNDDNITDPVSGQVVNTTAALRQNFIYEDLPLNPKGTLDIITSIITAQGEGMHDGWNASLFHHQDKIFGGANTLGLQYGVGPGTGIGNCCDRIGFSGTTALGSDVTRLRVFDSLWVQPTKKMSMELLVLMQRDNSDTKGSSTWSTFGVRPVYALKEHFKLQFEVGTDRVTSTTGPDLRLTKITFAPTITAGSKYWSRPELRAFITYAKWNHAATAAVNASNESGAVYGNSTSGTSLGVQLETWF